MNLDKFAPTSNPTRRHAVGIVIAASIAWGLKPANAFFSFGGANSATETTQWLNNLELMSSVNKQAIMVANQTKQYMTELQQWNATLQNITNLPASVYSTVMAPYNTVMGANQNFVSSVKNLQSAGTRFESSLRAKMAAAGTQGISGAEYMALEARLAREKGGVYKQQVNADIAQIDDLKARMLAVRETAARIPGLQGNVESLGLLNQQMNLAVTNLEEMRGVMLRESSAKAADNASNSAAKAAQAERDRQRLENARKAAEKNRNTVIPPIVNPFGQGL